MIAVVQTKKKEKIGVKTNTPKKTKVNNSLKNENKLPTDLDFMEALKLAIENSSAEDEDEEGDLEETALQKKDAKKSAYKESDEPSASDYRGSKVPYSSSADVASYRAKIDTLMEGGVYLGFEEKRISLAEELESFSKKVPTEDIGYTFQTSSQKAAEQTKPAEKTDLMEYASKVQNAVSSGQYTAAKQSVLEAADYFTGKEGHGCAGCAVKEIYSMRDQIRTGTYSGSLNRQELLSTIESLSPTLERFKEMHTHQRKAVAR